MNADLDEVRRALATRKFVDHCDYVTTSRLAEMLPYSAKELGQAMKRLEEQDVVDRFAKTSASGITWHILLDSPSEGSGGSDKTVEEKNVG